MLKTMETNTNPTTIKNVFQGKILQFIANNTMGSLAKKLAELCVGLVLGAFIFRPAVVGSFILETLKTEDYAIPKVLGFITIFYCRKLIYKIPGKARNVKRKIDVHFAEAHKQLDGIPVDELADYLIRNKNFRREGINGARQTFGLRMEKYNQLAKKLEEHGVLVRGENNLRVLSPKWSRQALMDFLSQSESSKTMGPWFRIHRIGANAKVRLDRQEINPVT